MDQNTSTGITMSMTHIGTATAIVDINGIKLLTDPVFPVSGQVYDRGPVVLKNPELPALSVADLPHIDGVLLSHEDHPDNLDAIGRTLLNGRKVVTTKAGAKNLAPRPNVVGMEAWETKTLTFGGREFTVTATPCKHAPNGECIGFLLQSETFGTNSIDGLPNAIYFSGDTVYIPELKKISERAHVLVAIVNLGAAHLNLSSGPLKITMGGEEVPQLLEDINADVVVPMHFESWSHFTQGKDALVKVFEKAGISEKICWLVPGESKRLL